MGGVLLIYMPCCLPSVWFLCVFLQYMFNCLCAFSIDWFPVPKSLTLLISLFVYRLQLLEASRTRPGNRQIQRARQVNTKMNEGKHRAKHARKGNGPGQQHPGFKLKEVESAQRVTMAPLRTTEKQPA
jgi:hypothetical protein